jgi:hypothetical protein
MFERSQNFVCRLSGAVDENIGSLTYAQRNHASIVRLHWHEIVGDYLHGVAVDAELLHGIGTDIHQPQEVFLARGEFEHTVICRCTRQTSLFARRAHFSVDAVAVGQWIDRSSLRCWSQQATNAGHVIIKVPVA